MASPIKSAFLQVHSIIGLAISLVLALMGLTGAMLSFEDEIVAALNRDVARVDVRSAPTLTPDEIVARLQSQPGAGRVQLMRLSSEPGATVRARFARNEAGERSSVYVDPYDGRILAPVAGEGFFATLRNLHRFLLLPGNGNGYGRLITGVSVIGLLVLLISGMVLRWPRHVRSLRMWLKPNLAKPGRAFHWSLHSVMGTWVLPIYLISILTGCRIGLVISCIVVFLAEMITSSDGLGHMLVQAARTFQTVDMFVPLITISLLGLILNSLLHMLRGHLLRGFSEV